jgi:hypothetical protein
VYTLHRYTVSMFCSHYIPFRLQTAAWSQPHVKFVFQAPHPQNRLPEGVFTIFPEVFVFLCLPNELLG